MQYLMELFNLNQDLYTVLMSLLGLWVEALAKFNISSAEEIKEV